MFGFKEKIVPFLQPLQTRLKPHSSRHRSSAASSQSIIFCFIAHNR